MSELGINDETMDEFSNRLDDVMMDREDASELLADVEDAMNDISIEMEGLTPSETSEAARLRSYNYMLRELKSTVETMQI